LAETILRGWVCFRFQMAAHRTQATWTFALLATISAGIAIARGVSWPDASFWASKPGTALVVASVLLQSPSCLAAGLAFGRAAGDVGAGCVVVVAAVEGDRVEGAVELAVSAAAEAVSGCLAA
jgi:hypothetical protein